MQTAQPTAFDPAQSSGAFRAALGSFATGVTIITTDTAEGQPVAIVANSFASVSLDPPLILWSPAKSSRRFSYFANTRRFAVHILSATQRDICDAVLASKTAINDIPHDLSHCGMPLIQNALATFECSLSATHDAGDHTIVVGLVTKAHHQSGDPLIFQGGQYGQFTKDG
jgi:flavin reductase (DIM6/NTAB) family NADH-FMN oxidoreductase RutF